MTLTHILPSLRRSISDPLDPDRWPEVTTATTTDVFVAGVSLLRLVDICETPCVHTAAAVVPGTHGHPSPTERAAAIVVRVTAVTHGRTGLRVEIDASLTAVSPILSETRLIGRASTAKTVSAALVTLTRDAAREDILEACLPDDLTAGDLLAIPCRGEVARRELRPQSAVSTQDASTQDARIQDATQDARANKPQARSTESDLRSDSSVWLPVETSIRPAVGLRDAH
jgi:hypothetical protein